MITLLEKYPEISWACAITTALGIFFVSSLTFPPAAPGFGIKGVIYHITAFFFLAFFLMPALTKGKHPKLIIIAAILAVVYAATDEFHQSFVPGRSSSLSDILIDNIGITFALILNMISHENRR